MVSSKNIKKDLKRVKNNYILTLSATLFSSPLRNYGGVYVGLPADLSTVAASQSKATRKGKTSTAPYCAAHRIFRTLLLLCRTVGYVKIRHWWASWSSSGRWDKQSPVAERPPHGATACLQQFLLYLTFIFFTESQWEAFPLLPQGLGRTSESFTKSLKGLCVTICRHVLITF